MKIGLVRHYKVTRGYPKEFILSQMKLLQWMDEYDASDIEPGETDLQGIDWKRCYASDLYRASKTAELIYSGEIIRTEKLREMKMYPLFKRNVRLPFILWPILMRLAWLFNHKSQLERKPDVEKRAAEILDEILTGQTEDVLIVSHGGLMIYLRQELIKRGYTGPTFGTAKNGLLYLFEQ